MKSEDGFINYERRENHETREEDIFYYGKRGNRRKQECRFLSCLCRRYFCQYSSLLRVCSYLMIISVSAAIISPHKSGRSKKMIKNIKISQLTSLPPCIIVFLLVGLVIVSCSNESAWWEKSRRLKDEKQDFIEAQTEMGLSESEARAHWRHKRSVEQTVGADTRLETEGEELEQMLSK